MVQNSRVWLRIFTSFPEDGRVPDLKETDGSVQEGSETERGPVPSLVQGGGDSGRFAGGEGIGVQALEMQSGFGNLHVLRGGTFLENSFWSNGASKFARLPAAWWGEIPHAWGGRESVLLGQAGPRGWKTGP